MKNKNIYLDNHSSTQIDERVYKQMIPFLTNVFGNPHSDSHSHGWISNKFIDLSRLKTATLNNGSSVSSDNTITSCAFKVHTHSKHKLSISKRIRSKFLLKPLRISVF